MDPVTLTLSTVVAIFALVGFGAAVVAWIGVSREIVILRKGVIHLRQALPEIAGDSSPDSWLHQNGFAFRSHFADGLMATWGGWRAGKVPTLAELHNLAARRERQRFSARLAGGITGLLVVIGIAGTLYSIHPILSGFNIAASPEGAVSSSQRANQANQLIQALGSAFLPSLIALGCTVVVAATRGCYSQSTSSLAMELDRFAVDFLLPTFRVRTFGEELAAVQENLSYLAGTMLQRDSRHAEFLKALHVLTTDLATTTGSLKTASEAMGEAARSLGLDVTKLGSGLERFLGPRAPVMTGLAQLDITVQVNKSAADQLAVSSQALTGETKRASAHVASACDAVRAAAGAVPESIRLGCLTGSLEIVASGRTAAAESAKAISTAMQNGSATLQQTITSATAKMETGAQKAGDIFIGSCATATREALTSISEQVAPITKVAGEISQANANLQSGVSDALNQHLAAFHDGAQNTLVAIKADTHATQGLIHDSLGKIVDQLSETERSATQAATMARDVLRPASELLNFFTLPKRWWMRARGGAKS